MDFGLSEAFITKKRLLSINIIFALFKVVFIFQRIYYFS